MAILDAVKAALDKLIGEQARRDLELKRQNDQAEADRKTAASTAAEQAAAEKSRLERERGGAAERFYKDHQTEQARVRAAREHVPEPVTAPQPEPPQKPRRRKPSE